MHFSISASAWVIFLGAVLWLFSLGVSVLNWRRSPKKRARWLEALRIVLITLIALTLLRPELVQLIRRTQQPEIAVLVDNSGSMSTRDIAAKNKIITRAEWLQEQKMRQFWKPLEKFGKVIMQEFSAGSTNGADGTDISQALENAGNRSGNLKTVILLSDGDWNTGKSPLGAAAAMRDQGVPVFTVAVGREKPVPDLVLESVSAPSYGLFGEEIAIPFKIRSYLPHEVKTSIVLNDPNWEEVKKEIIIPAGGELQDTVLWLPHVQGEATLSLKLPVEPDEGIRENNEKTFRVNIRQDKLKVLIVDSLPRWEYRYLRNALARDPGVEMNCILFHPEIGMGGGRDYLAEFPKTKEAISRYDVILLGDVGIGDNELTADEAKLIRGLVEQQSSGLIFLPGPRGREITFQKSPLSDLYPVTLDESKKQGVGLQNEAQLTLSSIGKHHLLTRFDSDESRNEELWKMLPGFYWSASVEKSRPGSEVLAVHSALRNSFGRMPILVTRAAGTGKVLFMGTDTAWRWRRGVEDKFHYRFWSQVVRWMAHSRHLSENDGMRVSFSPETPAVGDTVYLQATVLDASGNPAENPNVTGTILDPGQRTERMQFSELPGGWGVSKGTFIPQSGGKYKVQLAESRTGRKIETEILVGKPVREKVGQPINQNVLREIATITSGQSVSYERLDDVIRQITMLPEPKPLEKRIHLWSHPLWGGFIITMLCIYWIGRKWAGLV